MQGKNILTRSHRANINVSICERERDAEHGHGSAPVAESCSFT